MKEFHNSLTGEDLSEEDYHHAQQVWKGFNIQNLGQYHDLYLLTDVLLLVDIFENFWSTCQGQYGLDPAHYYTPPGLAWDAMLKKTGVELELFMDPDMHLFVEKGIHGGVSMIGIKYAVANNPYVKGYDSANANVFLAYLNANNLYGWSMSRPLPNLDNKTKYILHHIHLKQYLSLGLKLTKIHRILAFDQSLWLKPYIDFNTERRNRPKMTLKKIFSS